MQAAKEEALKQWRSLERNTPAEDAALTLGLGIEQYVEAKSAAGKMASTTATLARYNAVRYLGGLKDRTLDEIGRNRLAIRRLQQRITSEHGQAKQPGD
jgi:hypothetical protein